MFLEIVDAQRYNQVIGSYKYVYNNMLFHELNKEKVDEVVYMLFKESKYKLGIAAGIQAGIMKFPYSAPFSMFEFVGSSVNLIEIYEAVTLIDEYAKKQGIISIFFRFPPFFYDASNISKIQNILTNCNYHVSVCDLNFQFYIESMATYEKNLKRNARKNLNAAKKNNYLFKRCELPEEKKRAYDVIAINRKSKGYPLRMSYQQICDTIRLMQHDFFILCLDAADVAAAIVFEINEDICQVIYWGDVPGYSDKRPMNLLAAKVYEYYCNRGIEVLDIGPSTEEGVPNYGLCDFKESIGCQTSTKYTFCKNIL